MDENDTQSSTQENPSQPAAENGQPPAANELAQDAGTATSADGATAPAPANANTLQPEPGGGMFGEGLMASPASAMVVPTVLWVLVAFSIVTWAILLIKGLQFGRFKAENKRFSRQFWKSRDLTEGAEVAQHSSGALANLAQVGMGVLSGTDISAHRRELSQQINRSERLERSLRRQIQKERRSLENGLAILASIGSTAPFIGLFGTVWGIMEALVRIGITGEAGLDSVAGPIGHALIATGVGIAAAVPAVLVYNYFVRRLKLSAGDMEAFSEEFYSLAQENAFSSSWHPSSADESGQKQYAKAS